MDLKPFLKQYFGYNTFRPHQEDIITSILDKKDVVAILPTGSGKSLCYQLPAILNEGTTIVISPLIALMQDQVLQLTKQGIKAACVNSSITGWERDDILHNLHTYKLIYVSPERLAMEEFTEKLKTIPISGFVIDEAHCISQWGHSFRAEYRNLSRLKTLFPDIPVSAFTATATPDVEKDIATQLALTSPTLIKGSFDRENLTIRILEKQSYESQVQDFVKDHKDESGIVYAATRKRVDKLYDALSQRGYKVGKYHAGLTDQARSQVLEKFIHEDIDIVVATIAFGMGINKPNVRFVYHVDMPQNMEQYYQEIGRAGRDGLPATCVMLYSLKDIMLQKKFLEDIHDDTIRNHMRRKSEQMLALCNSAQCRRIEILHYFGETYPKTNCESCDNCLDEVEIIDGTIIAQKILSCVYRLRQNFGINYVIDVLQGSQNKTLKQRRHDQLSTYGLLSDCVKTEIRQYIFSLINQGYLFVSEGDYPLLKLTESAKEILFENKKIEFRKKQLKAKKESKKEHIMLKSPVDQDLYKELKLLRLNIAKESNVPPYVVFHDKTLIEMATLKPKDETEFLSLNGVGEQKLNRYGKHFLNAVKAFTSA